MVKNFIEALQVGFGGHDNRAMFWACHRQRNFGDWLGPYIYEKRTGNRPIYVRSKYRYRGRLLFTVGSIFHHIKRANQAVVWGSGIMHRDFQFAVPHKVLSVRGPYTSYKLKSLGYPTSDVYGDPGILMPLFYLPVVSEQFSLGVIPHAVDLPHLPDYFRNPEVKIIDLSQPIENVIDDILKCRVLLSSSLHGLIISNAFGKKAGWFRMGSRLRGDDVKFSDYYHGIDKNINLQDMMVFPDSISDALRALVRMPTIDTSHRESRLLACCPF